MSFLILITLLLRPAFSHESPEPIPILCGLKNKMHNKNFGPDSTKLIQYVTFSIPSSLIEEHFSVTEPFTIPYNIEIDTGEQIVKRSGEVPINVKNKIITVMNPIDPVNFPANINGRWIDPILFEFVSLESYEKSLFYNVVSCHLYYDN